MKTNATNDISSDVVKKSTMEEKVPERVDISESELILTDSPIVPTIEKRNKNNKRYKNYSNMYQNNERKE